MNLRENIDRLQSEIKVNQPLHLSEEDYDIIYSSLQGSRKPDTLEDASYINVNKLSKEYFIEMGYDEEYLENLRDDYIMFNIPKVKKALKELPVQNITDEQANNLWDVYINEQYSLLKYNNEYYFVDSQGFDYPRYLMKIIGL